MKIPVVLIIFNRPDLTLQVLDQIRKAQPCELFVISDGPRSSHESDEKNVMACRNIIETIDWPCEIYRKYANVNLGCRDNITSGLDWVFSKVNAAVILEDDCIPDLDFFEFCQEMLNKYENNSLIGTISGTNICLDSSNDANDSIFFSKFPSSWGWATWAHVWHKYEKDLSKWSHKERSLIIDKSISSLRAKRYWKFHLSSVASKRIDSWAYQFSFLHLRLGLLSIIPSVNLISNIGFREDYTHTLNPNDGIANLQRKSIKKPFVFPKKIITNINYDIYLEQTRQSMSIFRFCAETIYIHLPGKLKLFIRYLYKKI
jgi:hypothetical protein